MAPQSLSCSSRIFIPQAKLQSFNRNHSPMNLCVCVCVLRRVCGVVRVVIQNSPRVVCIKIKRVQPPGRVYQIRTRTHAPQHFKPNRKDRNKQITRKRINGFVAAKPAPFQKSCGRVQCAAHIAVLVWWCAARCMCVCVWTSECVCDRRIFRPRFVKYLFFFILYCGDISFYKYLECI